MLYPTHREIHRKVSLWKEKLTNKITSSIPQKNISLIKYLQKFSIRILSFVKTTIIQFILNIYFIDMVDCNYLKYIILNEKSRFEL